MASRMETDELTCRLNAGVVSGTLEWGFGKMVDGMLAGLVTRGSRL
jgi:hypothetical protein